MSATTAPLVVISVVNWNTADATLECLHALQAQSYREFRIVVIDNASIDDSVARIRAAHPHMAIVQSAVNLGFAGGHQLGLEHAERLGAAAVWLINSDACSEPDALSHMVAAWQQHGDAVYGGTPLRRHRDGGVMLNFPAKLLDPAARPKVFQRDAAQPLATDWQQRAPFQAGAAAGSCLLVPMTLVAQHGWLDAAWFLYCEEIDYCYRLRALGVLSYMVPAALVWHRGGASHRGNPGVTDCIHYYRTRNEVALAKRHASLWTAVLIAAKKIGRAGWTAITRPRRGAMIWLGVRDALIGHMGKTYAPEHFIECGNDSVQRVRPQARTPPIAGQALVSVIAAIKRLLGGIRQRLSAPDYRIDRVNHSAIAYNRQHTIFIRAYYLYCVELLKQGLARSDAALDLIVGNYAIDLGDRQPPHRVDIQFEHTLVKPGGRDSADATPGTIALPTGVGNYLVRIDRLGYLNTLDLVIDYSEANLANIRTGGAFAQYLEKTICIAPLLYAADFAVRERTEAVLTLFSDHAQPRRRRFLALAQPSLPIRNIKRVFDSTQLRALYGNTKVLVNIHQTDHHDTLEELRVLPALLCGVIVISENVPLKDTIPYSRFIIWADYDDIVATTARVLGDYDRYHQQIFNDPALVEIVQRLHICNSERIDAALRRLAARDQTQS